MADRKPSFFRSLISSTTSRRRPTTTRTPPATVESEKVSQSTTVASQNPKVDEKSNPKSIVPLAPPPSNEQVASPTKEPRTKSSSLPKTSPSSPSRRTPQSKSPPHSSSPRAQSTPSSPSRVASNSSSPLRVATQTRSTSRSPKQAPLNSSKVVDSNSSSKESTQEISSSYDAPGLDKPSSNSSQPHISTNFVQEQETTSPFPKFESSNGNPNGVKEVWKEPKIEAHGDANGNAHKEAKDKVEVPKQESVKEVLQEPKIEANGGTNNEAKDKPEVPKQEDFKEIFQEPKIEANGDTNNEANDKIEVPKQENVKEVLQEPKIEASGDTNNEAKDKAEVPKQENVEEMLQEQKIEADGSTNDKANDMVEVPRNNANNTNEASLAFLPTLKSTHQRNKKRIVVLSSGDHKDSSDDITTLLNKMSISDDQNVSVITLAGDNRGASMLMGSNGERLIHIHRSYKINPDANSEATSDAEEYKSEGSNMTREEQPEAFLNNNAQGINNSIVFNSSISERNPGVHLVVGHAPNEPIHSTNKMSPTKIRKSEFNMIRANKHTYEPRIRRRCLKGLFLEPSDSDTDDPNKPQRHGCRADRHQLNKDNTNDL